MTSDDIKRLHSMTDIVRQYGIIPNRAGFIPCPFHREKTASMKIYNNSYYCFGCGANGDIFTFVMSMDGISFKDAFLILGGEYEHSTFKSRLTTYKSKKRVETRKRKGLRIEERRKLNNVLIVLYGRYIRKSEPFSQVWCDSVNALQYQLYIQEYLDREGAGS